MLGSNMKIITLAGKNNHHNDKTNIENSSCPTSTFTKNVSSPKVKPLANKSQNQTTQKFHANVKTKKQQLSTGTVGTAPTLNRKKFYNQHQLNNNNVNSLKNQNFCLITTLKTSDTLATPLAAAKNKLHDSQLQKSSQPVISTELSSSKLPKNVASKSSATTAVAASIINNNNNCHELFNRNLCDNQQSIIITSASSSNCTTCSTLQASSSLSSSSQMVAADVKDLRSTPGKISSYSATPKKHKFQYKNFAATVIGSVCDTISPSTVQCTTSAPKTTEEVGKISPKKYSAAAMNDDADYSGGATSSKSAKIIEKIGNIYTTNTTPPVAASKSESPANETSISAPVSPSSYSLEFLHSVGVQIIGGGVTKSTDNFPPYQSSSNATISPSGCHIGTSSSGVTISYAFATANGHRQQRFLDSSSHYRPHHNHNQQQQQQQMVSFIPDNGNTNTPANGENYRNAPTTTTVPGKIDFPILLHSSNASSMAYRLHQSQQQPSYHHHHHRNYHQPQPQQHHTAYRYSFGGNSSPYYHQNYANSNGNGGGHYSQNISSVGSNRSHFNQQHHHHHQYQHSNYQQQHSHFQQHHHQRQGKKSTSSNNSSNSSLASSMASSSSQSSVSSCGSSARNNEMSSNYHQKKNSGNATGTGNASNGNSGGGESKKSSIRNLTAVDTIINSNGFSTSASQTFPRTRGSHDQIQQQNQNFYNPTYVTAADCNQAMTSCRRGGAGGACSCCSSRSPTPNPKSESPSIMLYSRSSSSSCSNLSSGKSKNQTTNVKHHHQQELQISAGTEKLQPQQHSPVVSANMKAVAAPTTTTTSTSAIQTNFPTINNNSVTGNEYDSDSSHSTRSLDSVNRSKAKYNQLKLNKMMGTSTDHLYHHYHHQQHPRGYYSNLSASGNASGTPVVSLLNLPATYTDEDLSASGSQQLQYWSPSPNSMHTTFMYSSSAAATATETETMSIADANHDFDANNNDDNYGAKQRPHHLVTTIKRSHMSSSHQRSSANGSGGGGAFTFRGRRGGQQQHQHNYLYSHNLRSTISSTDFFHTPPDRFLARAHLIEAKEPPAALLSNSKWDHLSQGIWNKFISSQQTEDTFKQKMQLWRYLYIIIKNSYPRYGLYLVGSTISGFGADTSDVDMCLVSRSAAAADTRLEALFNLTVLQNCLSKSGEFENFNLIEAKVPILRFRDRVHMLEVDLNFNNCVGIKNTHLLYCYSQIDWRLRPLVLITKLWAQYHNINNAKTMTISSYSLVLMVIHFLQCAVNPPVLPCLHELFPDKFKYFLRPNEFGYVDMNESIGPFESRNTQTLGELFLNFLEYYSCFDYANYAISIRTASVIPINVCRQVKAIKNDIHQWKELCIEEPFDLSNTARSVYDFETFERVKAVFITSWRILQDTLDLNSIFLPIIISIPPSGVAAENTENTVHVHTTAQSSLTANYNNNNHSSNSSTSSSNNNFPPLSS